MSGSKSAWNGNPWFDAFFGTLSNCLITGCSDTGNGAGGGVFLNKGGRLSRCLITGNTLKGGGAAGKGAGVFLNSGGLVENCLINRNTNNSPAPGGGGVYLTAGGVLRNCTISDNSFAGSVGGGGVYCNGGGTLTNCIISFNSTPSSTSSNWTGSGSKFAYCCTMPTNGLTGAGNIAGDPLFVNRAAGNYRLAWDSPCIDAGTNQSWMAGALDLDGELRILRRAVDIGAYESIPQARGSLLIIR
jgi:hypothetical protein